MIKSTDELGLTVISTTLLLLITGYLLYNWEPIEAFLTNKVSIRLIKY
jgi:hypothetical protein